MRVAYYNELELITVDTSFQTGTRNPGMIDVNTYNSKGKRIRWENTIPLLYTGGFYWALQDQYLDDTLPTATYRYLKGNQVARIAHLYNAARQLIMDSTYHTPNYGTFTYLTKYWYDALGRLANSTDLNDTRDTTAYITYQYAPNTVEKSVTSFNYNPVSMGYSKIVTEYTAAGKILSEKKYNGQVPQLFSQTDYTYDAAGHLLTKTIASTGAALQEERYINSATGKPEKMEYYLGGQLAHVTTYYYE
jgi:hypothetical protein